VGGIAVKFTASVEVSLLAGIANPEAATIEHSLPLLGITTVSDVQVGRLFRFVIDAHDAEAALETARSLADRLLANPVMERAEVAVGPWRDASR
jgi:phosphoribosylformylglycinamidine synthase